MKKMMQRLLVGLLSLLIIMSSYSTSAKKSKCEICTGMVKKFKEGIENTAKGNFGGGNTHWEEKSLGSFAFSETRFVEISEHSCESSDRECQGMLEEYEEDLENWWFKEFAKQTNVDLHQFLCMSSNKVCCPKGTFGATCSDCDGGKTNPCNGHGKCDGEGTREGTGKCKCDSGYEGELCDNCTDGYYEDTADDDAVCKACDESCEDTCSEGGPKGCDSCKTGWEEQEGDGCVDIDECAADSNPCQDGEYCSNKPGSHECLGCNAACNGCINSGPGHCKECAENYFDANGLCKMCHKACEGGCTGPTDNDCSSCGQGYTKTEGGQCEDVDECVTSPCTHDQFCSNEDGTYSCKRCDGSCDGCSGPTSNECKLCSPGYTMEDSKCVDIDECLQEGICTKTNEECKNKPGRYSCECKKGFKKKDGACVEKTRKPNQTDAMMKKLQKHVSDDEDKKMGKKTKKKTKSKKERKRKRKDLTLDHVKFFSSMIGFLVVAFILRRSWPSQLIFSSVYWIYLFWFTLRFDKTPLGSLSPKEVFGSHRA